jgi:xanthine/CO dehydrogenase XdhC/CoxF family maturation factor
MVDRRRIVRLWNGGGAQALVTLVRVEGSSYRRPGAHLLIGAGGECAGSISGGCLEAEVVRRAVWMVRAGAVVERYSTLFDDTAEVPFGLGCGGVVDLLLEPAETAECRALVEAMEASLGGSEARVVTWFPASGRPLRRAVIGADGTVIFRSEGLDAGDLDAVAARLMAPVVCDSEVYVEALAAPQRLFVLGAGEDAKPLATMASLLGWRVTVADGRAQLARAERFAEAERVLATASVAELEVRAKDAVVVMTHSYEQDRAHLAELLAGAAGYIGLLGAAHRSSLLIGEAAAQLGRSVAECCERVWAPVGMDLGGDGAEAIALEVVAEVQAWRQGKLGASRRMSAEDVARQIERGGASRYLQTQCAMGASE